MINYIVITDIGRDTDDTLALIILLYLHKKNNINLSCIAVSGAKLELRANSIYYWLYKFNITDISVVLALNEEFSFKPIDIDEKTNEIIKDVDSNICILPYNDDKTGDNINIFIRNIKTYNNLYEYFAENPQNIDIIAIAPIRPLYTALNKNSKLINKIDNIYFQGNAYYYKKSLMPDIRAEGRGSYNFGNGFPNKEEIMKETKYVIDLFNKSQKSKDNKLYFLGKNTAYLVEFSENDLYKIDKQIAELTITKTLLFAKSLPDVFNLVFKNNIDNKKKGIIIKKNSKIISNLINDIDSPLNRYIDNIKNRLKNVKDTSKLEYLNNELLNKNTHIKNIINNTEESIDSSYKLFIEFIVDTKDIQNNYTKDFLLTINKITNPYDLVLSYLVIFKKFFDFTKSSFLTQADKPYNNTRHIQFNEKNEDIFNKIKVKKHMITILRKSLKLIV